MLSTYWQFGVICQKTCQSEGSPIQLFLCWLGKWAGVYGYIMVSSTSRICRPMSNYFNKNWANITFGMKLVAPVKLSLGKFYLFEGISGLSCRRTLHFSYLQDTLPGPILNTKCWAKSWHVRHQKTSLSVANPIKFFLRFHTVPESPLEFVQEMV